MSGDPSISESDKSDRNLSNEESEKCTDGLQSELQKDVELKILRNAFTSKTQTISQLEEQFIELNRMDERQKMQIASQKKQIAVLTITRQTQYTESQLLVDELNKKIKEKNCLINNIINKKKKDLEKLEEKHQIELKNAEMKHRAELWQYRQNVRNKKMKDSFMQTEDSDDDYISCSEDIEDNVSCSGDVEDNVEVPKNEQSIDQIETATSFEADHLELSVRLLNIANKLLNIQDKKQQVNNALQTNNQFELDAEKEKNWMVMEENKALRAELNRNKKDHQLEVANLHNRLSDAYGFEKWE
ncbi:Protein CBG08879 [Caenorhabditis briggsae]|uniref:Protein CBG08879 n=1 Tax=Caenorhabditis briggsae TaxID=6238 RepID=A8X7L7_CAEBR|nr:Protein CBG08879 [Caenorhabditis briggsae]CAP28628.1 Protein CBG08879 [Caenorhabditis briggsae]